MSETPSITLDFFDINGVYEEKEQLDLKANFLLLECPMRIIDQYINETFFDIKKETNNNLNTQYTFKHDINEKTEITINCNIINNFSVSHQNTLTSNAYIVFCSLEKESTYDLLEKIITYIIENCSYTVKTYVIGVFKENIEENKTNEKMKEFLGSQNFDYEYYEMYIGDKDKYQMISREYQTAGDMQETFKNIFKSIYEGDKPSISAENETKDNKADRSNVPCNIF